MAEVISAISSGGLGMVIVMVGNSPSIITDGDLRRAIER